MSSSSFERFDAGTPLAKELFELSKRKTAAKNLPFSRPKRTRIVTVTNQKGGVGKTTTTVNLAAALARAGLKVLVIDLDPQGNATTALGVEGRNKLEGVYEVLVGSKSMAEVVQVSSESENLRCVPSNINLAGAEIELVGFSSREDRLWKALDAYLVNHAKDTDFVFIDCPPSLGLLTVNALVAAKEVLIPIQCEYYALEGLSQLLNNVELINQHLNPDLKLSALLLTMFDSRTKLSMQVAQEVRDHFPEQTLTTMIPRSVRVSEAPSYGQSVVSYDGGSAGALAYLEAASELTERGGE